MANERSYETCDCPECQGLCYHQPNPPAPHYQGFWATLGQKRAEFVDNYRLWDAEGDVVLEKRKMTETEAERLNDEFRAASDGRRWSNS